MTHTRFEIKLAAMIVAVLQLWIAFVIWWPGSADVLHQVLAVKGRDDDWAMVLAVLAAMVLYGSVKPKRACRHIGLALSVFTLVGVFGLVMEARQVTLSTGTVLILAVAALMVFCGDVVIGVMKRAELTGIRGSGGYDVAGR